MSSQETTNRLIRVAEVFNTIDANLIKGALENSDIFSEIEGENIANLAITISGIGNKIFIQVLSKDLAKAIEIITNLSVPVRMVVENA